MSRSRTKLPPERSTIQLMNMSTGSADVVAVAERLGDGPWAAVMLFHVGGGDTRLFVHAVLLSPDDWTPFGKRQRWLSGVAKQLGQGLPATGPDSQLTTRIIRSANTGELERWAREYVQRLEGSFGIPKGAAGGDRKSRGQRGGADRRLAGVAARYVELLATSATPTADLAVELDRPRDSVSSDLFKARERGLLTSAGRGRAGGALTDRARQLLTEVSR